MITYLLFLSFSLYLLAILLLCRGNLESIINQEVSWPHTVQLKQASGFRMQMSGQKWPWSILCSQLISFSLPLSRNRSEVQKWILVIHMKTSLSVAQSQPLEFQIKPDRTWAPICHPLFSPWTRWQHHNHMSLSNADKSKRNISNRYQPNWEECANAQFSSDRSEQVLAQSYGMGWNSQAFMRIHNSNLWDIVEKMPHQVPDEEVFWLPYVFPMTIHRYLKRK